MKSFKVAGATVLLAGTSLLGILFLLLDFYRMTPSQSTAISCQRVIQAQSTLSREQLARLLTIPERDKKGKIRAIVNEPYCELPRFEVRAGVAAEREAYPLQFDPQTWLIILYEGDEYAGYRISAR